MPWAWWRRWRKPPPDIDDARWAALLARAPLVRGLDPLRQARLRGLTARFLDRKAISPAHGLTLDDDDRLALASHACLPLLGIGEAGLRGWSEVIVHPGAFRVEHGRHGAPHEMDELELVEDGFEDREGESWQHGPMVLSWADLSAESPNRKPATSSSSTKWRTSSTRSTASWTARPLCRASGSANGPAISAPPSTP